MAIFKGSEILNQFQGVRVLETLRNPAFPAVKALARDRPSAQNQAVTPLERRLRHHLIASMRDTGRAPSIDESALALGLPAEEVRAALHALADAHRLALRPASDALWMVHPFSAVPSDFIVTSGGRTWWANCVWDGLSILALVGDGWLETHEPSSRAPIRLTVSGGRVLGDALVHFLVSARCFWDDIGFT